MYTRFLTLALVLLAALSVRGELLDRIAITVGKDVITEQEIYEQLRIATFLDGLEPAFTQQDLRDTADRMVLQRLVLQDMRANGFPLPSEDEMDQTLKQSQQVHWGSAEAFWKGAADAGISPEAMNDFLHNVVATMKYIDFRFRPAVRVADSALLERYAAKYNALDPQAGDPPAFEDVRDALEEEIVAEIIDGVVESWLEDARKRAGVRYKPEVLP
ncbi:MAG: hypothetical protein U5J83_07350 [Bryobacterales bacterium]|nr:hypothetical protein [Bryobacterales bacterium]